MSDERVWLRHTGHGGLFHCPAGAVNDWAEMGWEPTDDRPEEDNPVVAEMLAVQRAVQAAAAEAKSTKSSRKSGTDTTPQEG
jgi:hypothetical protein